MTNVFERNRKETKLQFYINALDLQVEITKYVMRENVVPKKWRYAIGYDLIRKTDWLIDFITMANSIYPTNWREMFLRKILQTLAIALCFRIQNKLILMEKCIETVKIEQMDRIIELVVHEMELLKAWKKSNKIIKL
ncbi:MAG: hypothetical protein IKN62_05410 [Elusimicrobia bacterium]|nr:hypothetical protein [Elusimicrobiota bacterium]